MVEDGLDLQLVLVVGVPLGQVAKLLGQVQAVVDVFRADEILGHLDAVVKVAHLVGRSSRDEDRVARALNNGVTYNEEMNRFRTMTK